MRQIIYALLPVDLGLLSQIISIRGQCRHCRVSHDIAHGLPGRLSHLTEPGEDIPRISDVKSWVTACHTYHLAQECIMCGTRCQ